jgi:hypothetical protein
MHPPLGNQRKSQAVFYAISFSWLDGEAVTALAQVTQTCRVTLSHLPRGSSRLSSIKLGQAGVFCIPFGRTFRSVIQA